MGETEAAARAHVAEHEAAAEDSLGLRARLGLLGRGVVALEVAAQAVHQLADAGEDGHFPHDGGEPFAADADVQVALSILLDGHLARAEAEAAQEGEVPQRQEDAAGLHELDLPVGDDDLGQVVDLLAQEFVEALGVDLVVAVIEGVLDFRPRVGLQDVVLAGEGVEVVVREMVDDRFHDI